MDNTFASCTIEELYQRQAELEKNLRDIATEIYNRRLDISHNIAAKLETIFNEAEENGIEIVLENNNSSFHFDPSAEDFTEDYVNVKTRLPD